MWLGVQSARLTATAIAGLTLAHPDDESVPNVVLLGWALWACLLR